MRVPTNASRVFVPEKATTRVSSRPISPQRNRLRAVAALTAFTMLVSVGGPAGFGLRSAQAARPLDGPPNTPNESQPRRAADEASDGVSALETTPNKPIT